MHPLLASFLTGLLRHGLSGVSGYLVAKGIFTEQDMVEYVAGFTLFAINVAWMLWVKYGERIDFVKALEAPAYASEAELKDRPQPRSLAKFVLPLLIAGSLAVSACGARGAKAAVSIDESSFTALSAAKLTKDAHCDAGLIPASACVSLARTFVPAWDAYLAINRALQSGTPLEQLPELRGQFRTAASAWQAEVNRLQDGEAKRILQDLALALLARF